MRAACSSPAKISSVREKQSKTIHWKSALTFTNSHVVENLFFSLSPSKKRLKARISYQQIRFQFQTIPFFRLTVFFPRCSLFSFHLHRCAFGGHAMWKTKQKIISRFTFSSCESFFGYSIASKLALHTHSQDVCAHPNAKMRRQDQTVSSINNTARKKIQYKIIQIMIHQQFVN